MALINFVAEFNSVIRYCFENGLPVRERMLLIALFYAANSRATAISAEYGNASIQYDWPEDFFTVSNAELNLYAGLDKRAILEARNSLCQRGIIEVRSGQRRAKMPEYKISYFSIGYKNAPKDTQKPPQNDTKSTPKPPQNDTKSTPITPQNHPLIYKQEQTKDTYTVDDDYEELDEVSLARARAREQVQNDRYYRETYAKDMMEKNQEKSERIKSAFLAKAGRLPNPTEIDTIIMTAHMSDTNDLIESAIERAARYGAGSVAEYSRKLLLSWNDQNIRDPKTLEDVEYVREMVKDGTFTADEGYKRIKELTGK